MERCRCGPSRSGPRSGSLPLRPSTEGPQGWKERGARPARRHRPRAGPDNRFRGCRGTAGAATAAVTAPPPPQLPQSALRAGCSQPGLVTRLHPAIRQIPWLVKVSMERCPYFQLACPRDVYHVVPAGASAPVRIRFSPAENKDYCHELVCMTARVRIVVPIRAIGARAVLDFRGQLDFSKCAVKCSTQQTLLLRNVGARAARYQLSTQRGSVTVPSLHFDLPELDFGDISFGFPYTQRCRLTNSSPVPLRFQLRMSDDGTQPAVDSVDQIRRHSDPAWRKGIHFYVEPREFTMNPSQGTILPQGHQDIEVTLCSNTVMEFRRGMLVDLEGIGKGVAKVIITARCLVPELQVSPYVLQYDECHLKVPYERKLVIRNPSHLPGCYGLIPQPQSTAEIPVVVEVQALGEHRTNVLIGVFGDERNPLAFSVLPLSGVLQPGQSQQVSSTFSGHLSSTSNVTELCHVEGGPTCEVLVTREASGVSSSLSPREINCGSQAPLRERRELKQAAQKLQEEAKAFEEEERWKEEERRKKGKKGVSVGKQPPKPEKGKIKPPQKNETKIPGKETKVPEKKEKKAAEKKETKAPEKKVTKGSERKKTKIPGNESKAPEKKEPKTPKKGEAKAPKKGGN
ncbi:unnamed protein product [Coccothraustes coccothraustes]